MKTKIYLTVLSILISQQMAFTQAVNSTEENKNNIVLKQPKHGWGKMAINENETYSFTTNKQVSGAEIYAIVFTDDKNGWAIGMMEFCSKNCGVIFYTCDGGQNWILQFKSGTKMKLKSLSFVDNANGRVYGIRTVDRSSFSILLATSNGGKTWEEEVLCSANSDLVTTTPATFKVVSK